jgi:hypothetical protein
MKKVLIQTKEQLDLVKEEIRVSDSVQSPQSASSSRSRRNSCQGNQSCIELFEFGSGRGFFFLRKI